MQNSWLSFLPIAGVLLLLIALSGCVTKPDIQVIKPQFNIPPQMLQCEDAGPRPKGEVIMESEVARYISNLEWANKDCKTRLKEIKILVECYNDSDCNVDKLAKAIGLLRDDKRRD